MFGILGSGFGLYGYLPALIQYYSAPVLVPVQYQTIFSQRGELQQFSKYIRWVENVNSVLSLAEGIVVAQRPFDQMEKISEVLQYSNIKNLILEKPLAPDPDEALLLMYKLESSGKNFRIGYNFRHLKWAKELSGKVENSSEPLDVIISWDFCAHHFRHNLLNWKRYQSEGGGILRFYGIHLIALLAECGFSEVLESNIFGINKDEPERWDAKFKKDKIACRIHIDSRSSSSRFCVKYATSDKKLIHDVNLGDPFEFPVEKINYSGLDRRVNIIQEVINSLENEKNTNFAWYSSVIQLWKNIELITRIN